jgi:hypothetical protein
MGCQQDATKNPKVPQSRKTATKEATDSREK